ncbi:MAG: DUF4157 domain-containing protein, partial [Spirochaetota bacterium]|nr:DUF4157 domain-containing protein [Spirochaetota bacterium]
ILTDFLENIGILPSSDDHSDQNQGLNLNNYILILSHDKDKLNSYKEILKEIDEDNNKINIIVAEDEKEAYKKFMDKRPILVLIDTKDTEDTTKLKIIEDNGQGTIIYDSGRNDPNIAKTIEDTTPRNVVNTFRQYELISKIEEIKWSIIVCTISDDRDEFIIKNYGADGVLQKQNNLIQLKSDLKKFLNWAIKLHNPQSDNLSKVYNKLLEECWDNNENPYVECYRNPLLNSNCPFDDGNEKNSNDQNQDLESDNNIELSGIIPGCDKDSGEITDEYVFKFIFQGFDRDSGVPFFELIQSAIEDLGRDVYEEFLDKSILVLGCEATHKLLDALHYFFPESKSVIKALAPSLPHEPENGLYNGLAQNLSRYFPENYFDIIISFGFLHDDYFDLVINEEQLDKSKFYSKIVEEIIKILKPGGKVYISRQRGNSNPDELLDAFKESTFNIENLATIFYELTKSDDREGDPGQSPRKKEGLVEHPDAPELVYLRRHKVRADRTIRLDSVLKNQFERAFDVDLSDVRIHIGIYADEITRDAGADAVTIDADIYFASGKYNPDTDEGIMLLAHELQHVIQHIRKERLVYREDYEKSEYDAERAESILRELGLLHNIESSGLSQYPYSTTGDYLDQTSGYSYELEDFMNSDYDKDFIYWSKPDGELVYFTQEQYNEFVEQVERGLRDWLNEEKFSLPEQEYDKLILKVYQWSNTSIS